MSTSNTAGQKMTDAELAKLEKRIAAIYREAYNDLTDTIRDYFGKFAARDAVEKARLDAGEISEDQYKLWRAAQIGRGKRFEALRDKVAERMTNANATAIAYINDATPGIYSLNRNLAAYMIEQVAGDVGFDLWDERVVKRLIAEQPGLMPSYPEKRALKRGIDLAYGKKQITASVTSSILQGRSIKGMADDLQSRITTMNRDSAIRTARTAVTGAQNAGRLDSYYAAEKWESSAENNGWRRSTEEPATPTPCSTARSWTTTKSSPTAAATQVTRTAHRPKSITAAARWYPRSKESTPPEASAAPGTRRPDGMS